MFCYMTCHVMLYNICHVMLYNICHVLLYNMSHVMSCYVLLKTESLDNAILEL